MGEAGQNALVCAEKTMRGLRRCSVAGIGEAGRTRPEETIVEDRPREGVLKLVK
jgi:hypothetical protein